MNNDPRVQELLDRLLADQATPEEVCCSCPELLPEIRVRWRELCHVQAELDVLFPAPDEAVGHPPVQGNALPQIPGYEVEALLGRGGMGVVFRARHLRLNRVVALKMLIAGTYAGPSERERFQREAEVVAALRHPNIVQIHDVGESDGRPYFTMELVEGDCLAAKLKDRPQPAREAAALLAILARAIQSAHGAGIVHRDLKPANILLTDDGIPKISDFGLARRLDDGAALTRTGAALGTPSFMAPEQAGGEAAAVGPAVDIYALGAILYQMLTGRPPFAAGTAAATIQQVISQEPVPPSRLNAKVPRDLETICMKCLHKEPQLRYATAAAQADDLDCFLRGEAIAACPERRLERLVRLVRRRPVLSTALAAHPGDVWVNLTLGSDMFALDKREEAIAYFRAALAVRPRAAIVHTVLGATLFSAGRKEEALEHLRQAAELDSTTELIQKSLAIALSQAGRSDEALERMPAALRANPKSIPLLETFGSILEAKGRLDEALTLYQRAIEIDPKAADVQRDLRNVLLRQGRAEAARAAWAKALESDPPEHDAWYGYAELCLFLGQEEEYRRARRTLLAKFSTTADPFIAERTGRACLLLPVAGDELRQAAALGECAAAADRAKYRGFHAYFQFVQGLAEHRQGRLDRAISLMCGDAARVLGPAPRLVLSMALHKSGQVAEARKALATAIVSHDWSPKEVRDQDGWIYHILRREAESMILPNLPAFLSGHHEPEDNDERLALLGVCQFTNRTCTAARLYADAFADAPRLAEDLGAGHRYNAARAAALAGCGRGEDGASLSQEERTRWRKQARAWLELDLAAWAGKLDSGTPADRAPVRQRLTGWQANPDLAGVRELGSLEKLSVEERDAWLALWKKIDALLNRKPSP
jgi:tetratricopeptide (TPR) repeat protein